MQTFAASTSFRVLRPMDNVSLTISVFTSMRLIHFNTHFTFVMMKGQWIDMHRFERKKKCRSKNCLKIKYQERHHLHLYACLWGWFCSNYIGFEAFSIFSCSTFLTSTFYLEMKPFTTSKWAMLTRSDISSVTFSYLISHLLVYSHRIISLYVDPCRTVQCLRDRFRLGFFCETCW